MPGIKCKCGNVIKTGEIPNPNEWLIISDVDYDLYSGSINSEELYKEMKSMLICNKCSRLWIYWEGSEKEPVAYIIDPEI
ncbi:MAG TPA: hypothetical protein VK203_22380 [Nostocaceae cyanobacterium]|nr:hypothetical protein [Nostocaceae cyanobacterium]